MLLTYTPPKSIHLTRRWVKIKCKNRLVVTPAGELPLGHLHSENGSENKGASSQPCGVNTPTVQVPGHTLVPLEAFPDGSFLIDVKLKGSSCSPLTH
jgi:hypothetical protein